METSISFFQIKGKAKYVTSKLDGKEYCKTNGQFKRHLRNFNLSEQEYFERYIGSAPKCICGASRKMNIPDWSFLPTCGQSCKNEYLRLLKTEIWSDEKKKEVNQKVSVGVRKSNTPEKLKLQHDNLLRVIETRGDEIKERRRKTSLERHGDPTYSNSKTASQTRKNFSRDRVREIYRKSNLTKEARYGHCKMQASKMLKYKDPTYWKPIISKIRETCLKKYNKSWIPMKIGPFNSGPVSKVEKKFVQMLIDAGVNCRSYLSENGQFSLSNHQRSFFFDVAVLEKKKLIEFNGDFWHANPKAYKPDHLLSFGRFKAKAEDLWVRDAKKIAEARKQGFEVLTVWESDFYKDPQTEVDRCLSWLNE